LKKVEKANTFKEITDALYNGAFNKLTFHKNTRNTFVNCLLIIGVGVAGSIYFKNAK
jgi:hypothetical protein